jgi:anti-sigma factor RsiW
MGSLIHELENNEALLLMYVADELGSEDRADVEQMLASDGRLRADLAQIRSAYDGAMAALATLDRDKTQVPAENHAVRQATRAMRQWQVDQLARQPMMIPTSRVRVPVWAYPVGVAAMLLIGSLIWWGGQPDVQPKSGSAEQAGPLAVLDPASTHFLENSFSDSHTGLADAENEASMLASRSDNDSVASSIFSADQNQ